MRQAIRRFDAAVDTAVMSLPKRARFMMEFFTLIGQPPFTVGIAATVLGYGAALNKSHFVIAGSIAIATLVLTSFLKLVLRRARPVNDYVRSMLFQTFSFPSGHAAGAVVSYGLAAAVISGKWPEYAILAWVIAIVLWIMIGLSRIYLGAHYASDVIGGWIVGLAGLSLILTMGV